MISEQQLRRLRELLAIGKGDNFYGWRCWRRLAARVKSMDNYECQYCKVNGRYAPGEIVHHVKHLKDRPDLALSIWDPATGERQLVTLCRDCHTVEHPEHLQYSQVRYEPLTEERWD